MMKNLELLEVEVQNFRSIRGRLTIPLDASIVLIHGENGAGKTSLLSAIELAVTGSVSALRRVDPGYELQLVHRSMTDGHVKLKIRDEFDEHSFKAQVSTAGLQAKNSFDDRLAAFFRERSFLPQSLLGQLLQIYQDASSDASSPLAQFVGKLLGLDQLDALEAGLQPLLDIRNVRKVVDNWLATENEIRRLRDRRTDRSKARKALSGQIAAALLSISEAATSLEIAIPIREETLTVLTEQFAVLSDSQSLQLVSDQLLRVSSLQRETLSEGKFQNVGTPASVAAIAARGFEDWRSTYGVQVALLRETISEALPNVVLPEGMVELANFSRNQLEQVRSTVLLQLKQIQEERARLAQCRIDWEAAQAQCLTVDQEIASLPSGSDGLAKALAELASFIVGDTCPVCDRNYSEIRSGQSLSSHIHGNIRRLSASAERLLALGRSRAECQRRIELFATEIERLERKALPDESTANLVQKSVATEELIRQVDFLSQAITQGEALRAADVTARRFEIEKIAQDNVLAAATQTAREFAILVGVTEPELGEALGDALARVERELNLRKSSLEARLSARRSGRDAVASLQPLLIQRRELEDQEKEDRLALEEEEHALGRAQALREQGNQIRTAVDGVRSLIIRREFNDRLNLLWRDLFIRLAPSEPFVPAFRIPQSSTRKLHPKLITEHRAGGQAGGTPGAMLSAGNLNTAALTLFIALHLSVPPELPWLILDDPVQSMDDVHIAQFAALLRTIAKEHTRQIIIAVHDRQLFEYLKLELSPAFEGDSLLAIELERSQERDTSFFPTRLQFKEEVGLLAA